MGAKCWILVQSEGPADVRLRQRSALDVPATEALVARLHPGATLTDLGRGSLLEHANPPDDEVWAAVHDGVSVLCTARVARDRPTHIEPSLIRAAPGWTTRVAAMHSVVDWFAFAIWAPGGELQRSLSLSPDNGVMEDLGPPLPFERPYWAGDHPLDDDYPLPFHPLEFGEEALGTLFGFGFEGSSVPDQFDPEELELIGFRIGAV